MCTWIALAAGAALVGLALAAAAWLAIRRSDDEGRALAGRIARLPWRAKLRLGIALAREPRVPILLRAVPPAVVLYLAMPIDIIPDFIPFLGHLDDVLIVLLGAALLLRFTHKRVLEEHIYRLERPADR